ncbi:MAG: hypothetical protein FJW24_03895 [Acidimicrobiia bacterium]|nr:hypothetical protein [Acidimicrobiia bacterium]
MLKAAIRLPVGAFKPRLAFSGPANGVTTKFDTLMTAVVFAERGEVATAQSILSSLGSRLTAGGPRSLGRIVKTAGLGLASAALYGALYAFERPILAMTAEGGYSLFLVIAIAFAFSAVHGAFTGRFWDTLGLKARK